MPDARDMYFFETWVKMLQEPAIESCGNGTAQKEHETFDVPNGCITNVADHHSLRTIWISGEASVGSTRQVSKKMAEPRFCETVITI